MRISFFLRFGVVIFALSHISCQDSKQKQQAQKITLEFFNHLKVEDEAKATRLYPGFKNFPGYYKTDSVSIKDVEKVGSHIVVSATSIFTNGFGKRNMHDIDLIFKKDSTGNVRLSDSKGLTDFSDKDDYKFGLKTGCISSADTTDQQILAGMQKASTIMTDKALDIYMDIKSKINVVTWNWESGYGNSASGKCIVRNASEYQIPKLKYKVSFRDKAGGEVTSEDGYVTYDKLSAGESKSFTFYSSYVGNASSATITFTFDIDAITEYLANETWTGNECAEYFKAK